MIKNTIEAARKKKGLSIPFVLAEYKKLAGKNNGISKHVFWQIRKNERTIKITELLILCEILGEKDPLKLITKTDGKFCNLSKKG
jgi:hypothetical protein